MTETEFDEIMSSEIRKIVAGRNLPDGFSVRLAQSAKSGKIAWRIKTVLCTTAVIALGISIIGISRGTKQTEKSEPMIMAADATSGTPEASGWFLLGYLRECFKRNRNYRTRNNISSWRSLR